MAGKPTKLKGITTRNGKPVWKNDDNIEGYSEKTATYDYGDGYIVTPTIDPATGGPYKIDDLFKHYEENGPYDLYTGEKLPVFDDESTATEYSIWRSDNILNFDLTDQEFYAGESDTYFKQNGSDFTLREKLRDYKEDAKSYATEAVDGIKRFFGSEEDTGFALGGIATATKGITTQEGKDMAAKKFQLDDKQADLNDDNKLSAYEKARGEAIQKNTQGEVESEDKREAVSMYHGGTAMPCGCGEMEECGCGGMMMDGLMGYDDVSGNPIPIGSNPENVRDDIDAKLSTDEYVLPAHVVKWHGLKHIQMMQSEAEMGLMSMQMDGLIQYADNEDQSNSEGVEDSEVSDASDTQQKEAKAEAQASEEIPSEEMDVEVVAVEVDDKMDDTEETEKMYPKTSALPGMVKKQKVAFLY